MIDTHLHILPGIDDGPGSLDESLALAHSLVQEGVHTAIATPHYNDEFEQRSLEDIRGRVHALQQELDSRGIQLRVFPGHEVLIKPGLVGDIQRGRLATLNASRYLLLELWSSHWPPETERAIFDLRSYGIVPILAHVERYHAIQRDPERLAALLRQGALAQLTASSLIGMHGRAARRCAETLLKKGMIHILGSDAHGLNRRPPALTRSIQRALELVGPERTYQLVEVWPAAIIRNEVFSYDLRI
jgi:protein-tyrosine phosphatase